MPYRSSAEDVLLGNNQASEESDHAPCDSDFDVEEDFQLDRTVPRKANIADRIHQAFPKQIQYFLAMLEEWLDGPQPPRPFSIKILLPKIQAFPEYCSRHITNRLGIPWLFIWSVLCGSIFVAILARSESTCQIPPYGNPVRLSCVDRFWRGSADCGLDGVRCRPFNNDTFAFRCPANCHNVKVLEPYTIGNLTINYQSLIVGGGSSASFPYIYRGDSFICPAAIHAGQFSAARGGSGIVRLVGASSNYTGMLANGLQGLSFTPTFPQSFTFDEFATSKECADPRWVLMAVSITYGIIISLCNTSSSQFFGTIFISSYFCVALAADAPEPSSFTSIVSSAFRGFLPASFVGFVIYQSCVKHTLTDMKAPFDKTILWLGPFWVGALDNMTFDLLPLQRLTPHDFMQPGAVIVLFGLVSVILLAAIGQIWAFRIEGRLIGYLKFYALLAVGIIGMTLIPNLHLRLHHYIIALLLLPGTSIQTRPSLVYQGLLVGLFINGIARWGFDSILQTSSDLFATDLGGLVPEIDNPIINGDIIVFTWSAINAGYNSLSVLVNDVEKHREYEDHVAGNFTYIRTKNEVVYFRFGFVEYGKAQSSSAGKYSSPGTWLADGRWIPIEKNHP